MRQSKQKQRKAAYKQIEGQGEELIDKYGWNKTHVAELVQELKTKAFYEIEDWGDREDLSNCWSLVRYLKNNFRIVVFYNRDLLEQYYLNADDTILFLDNFIEMFRYIEFNTLNRTAFKVVVRSAELYLSVREELRDPFLIKIKDLKKIVKEKGEYESARVIYYKVLEL